MQLMKEKNNLVVFFQFLAIKLPDLYPDSLEMLDPDPSDPQQCYFPFPQYWTRGHDLMALVPFIRCSVCGATVGELPTYEPAVPDRDGVAAVSLARFQKKGEAPHHGELAPVLQGPQGRAKKTTGGVGTTSRFIPA